MDEREVEKRICRLLWESFDDFFDELRERENIRLMDNLRDRLVDALPYSSEEVRG